MKIAECPD